MIGRFLFFCNIIKKQPICFPFIEMGVNRFRFVYPSRKGKQNGTKSSPLQKKGNKTGPSRVPHKKRVANGDQVASPQKKGQ